ncbi:MAG: hypothetical protein SWX82_07235 [Cyanobacteriota bacterium]|nr:hypothetical protein [Cyanobacteriota bacterium]
MEWASCPFPFPFPGIKDVKPVAIPSDHNSIAKPGKNDLLYLSALLHENI